MEFIIFLFFLIGVGMIIWAVLAPDKYKDIRFRLPDGTAEPKGINVRAYFSFILPLSRKMVEKLKLDIKLKHRLDAAHANITVAEFFSIKLFFILLLSVSTFFIFKKVDFAIILGAIVLGYVLPDMYINRKIAKHKYAISRLLPETVDLLSLCVEAGLDFTTSVRWVIEKVPSNPMVRELAFVLEEIKWGKPRTQALKDMSRRLNIPEVSSFVQTLVQAERMGTPVTEAFTILSEDTRLQRFHKGERIALQAPLKILIPLIFCILPVIGIVIGGPIFLQFMEGGMLKGF